MLKKTKRTVFYVGGVIILIIVIFLSASSYKKTKNNAKTQYRPSDKPIIPLTELPNNKVYSNENIPAKRENINSQLTLERRKRGQKLSPAEEKKIIESLESQVSINKDKSFFDYK